MFVDLDWPLNASSLLSASAELLVYSLRLLLNTDPTPCCQHLWSYYHIVLYKFDYYYCCYKKSVWFWTHWYICWELPPFENSLPRVAFMASLLFFLYKFISWILIVGCIEERRLCFTKFNKKIIVFVINDTMVYCSLIVVYRLIINPDNITQGNIIVQYAVAT